MRRVLPFAFLVATLTAAAPARAGDFVITSPELPRHPPFVEIGAEASMAAVTDSSSYDPFGMGLRARAGVVLHDVYAGVIAGGYGGAPAGPSSLLAGAQLGYGFHLVRDLFVLRPMLGAGVLAMPGTNLTNGVYQGPPWAAQTPYPVFVEPAVTLLFLPGPGFFGLNAGFLMPAMQQLALPGGFPVGASASIDFGFRLL